jgi:hypothetical protein
MASWVDSINAATQTPLLVEWLFSVDEDPDKCVGGSEPGTDCTVDNDCDDIVAGDGNCTSRGGIFGSMGSMFQRVQASPSSTAPWQHVNKPQKTLWQQINTSLARTATVTMNTAVSCTATFALGAGGWDWNWNWGWGGF